MNCKPNCKLSGLSRMNALKKRLLEFSSAAEWVKREGERVDDIWDFWARLFSVRQKLVICCSKQKCWKCMWRGREECGWYVRLFGHRLFSVQLMWCFFCYLLYSRRLMWNYRNYFGHEDLCKTIKTHVKISELFWKLILIKQSIEVVH